MCPGVPPARKSDGYACPNLVFINGANVNLYVWHSYPFDKESAFYTYVPNGSLNNSPFNTPAFVAFCK